MQIVLVDITQTT